MAFRSCCPRKPGSSEGLSGRFAAQQTGQVADGAACLKKRRAGPIRLTADRPAPRTALSRGLSLEKRRMKASAATASPMLSTLRQRA